MKKVILIICLLFASLSVFANKELREKYKKEYKEFTKDKDGDTLTKITLYIDSKKDEKDVDTESLAELIIEEMLEMPYDEYIVEYNNCVKSIIWYQDIYSYSKQQLIERLRRDKFNNKVVVMAVNDYYTECVGR